MWRIGVSNSYTMEVAFGGSTLGEGPPQVTVSGVSAGSCPHVGKPLLLSLSPVPSRQEELALHRGGSQVAGLPPLRHPARLLRPPSCQGGLKLRHPGWSWCHRGAAVTLAPSCSSSSACRRWTHCCSSGWAGSRAPAGAMSPRRSSNPGTAQPGDPAEPRVLVGAQAFVSPSQHQRLRQLCVRRAPSSPPWPGTAGESPGAAAFGVGGTKHRGGVRHHGVQTPWNCFAIRCSWSNRGGSGGGAGER